MRGITIAQMAVFALLITACKSSTTAEEKLQEQSVIVRQEALKLAAEISPELKVLVQRKNAILVQGRPILSKEMEFFAQVEELENDFYSWQEQIDFGKSEIGRPGWEDAKNPRSVREWLKVQQEFLAGMQSIKKEIAEMMKN